MNPAYLRAWLVAFAFTQLIEVPLYRRVLDCSIARAFGATALTHPVIWFLLFPFVQAGYVEKVAAAELFAVVAEALYFAPSVGLRRAAWASFLANAVSFCLGLLSRAVLGAP